ncbi:MAG: HDOD domain-containing protein [Verrucomicrobiales bacterium]|nr:HDOD domain-containing protein [Verrucomicrobiales bacterium]
MIDLDRLIEQANELAPLPASAVRLAQLVGEPDCHIKDVAELIAFDQALTVKLLRAANSAFSASATPVGTVQEAVTRMGTAHVLALAIASGARPLLQARVPAYGLDEGALWRHSVAAAVAAETAPSFCHVQVPPETFTAALLHDVGKLVMGRFLSPEILSLIRRAQEIDHLSQLEVESVLLNVHHGELGGLIAQHWNLPPRVIQGIIYHHNPEQGLDVICDVTYLANQVAKRIEANLDGRRFDLAISPESAERLGLTPKNLDNLCPIAASRYAQVSRRFNAV